MSASSQPDPATAPAASRSPRDCLRRTPPDAARIRRATVHSSEPGVTNRLVSDVSAEHADGSYLPNAGAIVLDADMDSPTGWRCLAWGGLAP